MSKTKTFLDPNAAMNPQIFYILLSLAQQERHGYEIMKKVEEDSKGKVRLGPGTLYGAIKRMLAEKLIVESEKKHTRRRYYSLTEKGRSMFHRELERYSEAVAVAQKYSLFDSFTKPAFSY